MISSLEHSSVLATIAGHAPGRTPGARDPNCDTLLATAAERGGISESGWFPSREYRPFGLFPHAPYKGCGVLRAVPGASRSVARGMQHNVYQFGAQIVLLPAITGIDRKCAAA
jgi:hypothetical protein